ncbi:SRPBCC family protein [Oxalobacteraceae bacterium A2-2]
MTHTVENFDPTLDLYFEREVDISPAKIWAAWTQPEHIVHWFTPAPWKTVEAQVDLRPGGLFRTVMESPDGARHVNIGTFLEIVPNQRLVWTTALGPGFRPTGVDFVTAFITLEDLPGGRTRYIACARHKDEATLRQHQEMGFEQGWNAALEQLIAHMSR